MKNNSKKTDNTAAKEQKPTPGTPERVDTAQTTEDESFETDSDIDASPTKADPDDDNSKTRHLETIWSSRLTDMAQNMMSAQ
jgi:hypothetical protein